CNPAYSKSIHTWLRFGEIMRGSLSAGYRLLKNAGCLPPELEHRREAIQLLDILKGIRHDDPQYQEVSRRLSLLELKLRQAGLSTDFLRGDYADKLLNKINDN
ncbi:DUF1992 domain-containing protein, partial [Escherichia coli]|uniref:DUF1992 domain-containing protein n=1 Tax=Escherichia coli TaxID=562 RepID=UPI001EDE5C41